MQFIQEFNDVEIKEASDVVANACMGLHYYYNKRVIVATCIIMLVAFTVLFSVLYVIGYYDSVIELWMFGCGLLGGCLLIVISTEKKYKNKTCAFLSLYSVRCIELNDKAIIVDGKQYNFISIERVIMTNKYYLLEVEKKTVIIKRSNELDSIIISLI